MTAVEPPGQLVAVAAMRAGLAHFGWTAHVSTQKPVANHALFVVLSRIGGGKSNFATSAPRFLVECYAANGGKADELKAEQLALTATAALSWTVGREFAGHDIRWWKDDDNIARFDDPNPSHSRFQFTGELSIAIS